MSKIQFPIIEVSKGGWPAEEGGMPLDSEYIYTSSDKIFDEFFRGREYCDCSGKIYLIQGKEPLVGFWPNLLKYLPGTRKAKVLFKSTDSSMTLDDLKQYMLTQVKKYENPTTNEALIHWMDSIKNANNFKEAIG